MEDKMYARKIVNKNKACNKYEMEIWYLGKWRLVNGCQKLDSNGNFSKKFISNAIKRFNLNSKQNITEKDLEWES